MKKLTRLPIQKLGVHVTIGVVASYVTAATNCPDPIPTCKVWGVFSAIVNPLCCEDQDNPVKCRETTAERWSCAAGGQNRYRYVTAGSWSLGFVCDTGTGGCY
jgi:hypothetical protein